MPPGQARKRRSGGVMTSVSTGRIVMVLVANGPANKLPRWVHSRPIRLGCMTPRAMFGNGCKTIGATLIKVHQKMAGLGSQVTVIIGFFAAVLGTIGPATSAVRSAAGTLPTIDSMISAFGWCWVLPGDC